MNLEHLLMLLVFNELVILGVWTLFDEGMLFGTVAEYAESFLPEWVTKPLYDCPPCQASVWGSTVFWLSHEFTYESLITWPFYCLALCGLGKLVVTNLLKW